MRESAAAPSFRAGRSARHPERDTTALSVERVCCCVYMICILYIYIYTIFVFARGASGADIGQTLFGICVYIYYNLYN